MKAVQLFQNYNSTKCSHHTFIYLKNTQLLRSASFHFLWFYSIASLTIRSQTPVLEEDMHKRFSSSKRDNGNPKQTLNGDFSKDIFGFVWFFVLWVCLGDFLPVHTLTLISCLGSTLILVQL